MQQIRKGARHKRKASKCKTTPPEVSSTTVMCPGGATAHFASLMKEQTEEGSVRTDSGPPAATGGSALSGGSSISGCDNLSPRGSGSHGESGGGSGSLGPDGKAHSSSGPGRRRARPKMQQQRVLNSKYVSHAHRDLPIPNTTRALAPGSLRLHGCTQRCSSTAERHGCT